MRDLVRTHRTRICGEIPIYGRLRFVLTLRGHAARVKVSVLIQFTSIEEAFAPRRNSDSGEHPLSRIVRHRV